jgi:cysteine-rich repeat protein
VIEDVRSRRSRRQLAVAVLLVLAVVGDGRAEPPAGARIGDALARALEQPLPAEGLAIAVTLRESDLPRRGPDRRAAVAARQQRALDAIPAGGLRIKRRYRSLAGFAGWARRGAIEALARQPDVEAVYVDGRVYASLAQGVSLVGADGAHVLGFTGAGVKVAVLDTGVDSDHPDIADGLAGQQCFCDSHPSPRRGCCPGGGEEEANAEDDEGHGTSVTGIITSDGVAAATGVAPDAEVVAVKVLDSGGSGSFSDIAAALDWLLSERGVPGSPAEGVDIVNLSLGDGSEHNSSAVSPCTGSNTANAIAALYAEGVAVFVASGNEGHDDGISFPACVARAISVGGVYDAALGSVSWCGNASCTTILCADNPTAPDTFVCHSNSDELLDVLAPNWRTTTANLGGGTTAFGGTSASSPFAAAQAALLLQANPSLSPEEIRSHMKANGAQVTNPANGLSFTRSDIVGAILAAMPSVCGNGSVETGEDCDDGGNDDGDCCSATCSFEAQSSPCDDGDACTDGDSCDGSGGCDPGGPLACDDGLFCNGPETCAAAPGCQAGTAPVTDDGVDCTADSCDEAADAVVHAPDDASCDDGVACTADACDAIAGCTHDPIPWCGTDIAARPRRGPAILALLVLASGALLLAPTRRTRRR